MDCLETTPSSLSLNDFGHIGDDRLRRLLTYWLSSRDGALIPSTERIDPLKFHFALSNIWLCDVIDGTCGGRWRYRIVGDEVRRAYGRNIVGKTLQQITEPIVLSRVARYFAIATDGPAVVHVGGRLYSEAAHPARGERIILPFGDPRTGAVTQLLGATFHSWLEPGFPSGGVPAIQTRTYTPVDGSPATVERLEQAGAS